MDEDKHSTLSLKDGRIISYAEYGDPQGLPMIGFHGMPGSRLFMKAFGNTAQAAGVRLIAPERPGYGYSSADPGGTLLGYTDDVESLADALNLERFVVLGASGGGPYAQACAYRLPQRLRLAAMISSTGPFYWPGSMSGMASVNRRIFTLGRIAPGLVGFLLPLLIRSSLPSMNKHVLAGTSPNPSLGPKVFAIIAADQAEVIRSGGKGIVYDMKNYWRPWKINFGEIKLKFMIWHGEADDLAPSASVRHVASLLPNCTATFFPGEGHADAWLKHDQDIMQSIVREGWNS